MKTQFRVYCVVLTLELSLLFAAMRLRTMTTILHCSARSIRSSRPTADQLYSPITVQSGGLRGLEELEGRVTSQYPLDRVEIISNGQVVYEVQPKTPSVDIAIDKKVQVTRSGWIAIRASGPAHRDQPTGTLFGHTSAVYLDMERIPIDAEADAAYFVDWIDRLRADIRKRNRIPGRHQVHVKSQIAQAREVFNKLLP